jgi:predicted transposase YbfD/YdcC
LKFEEEHGYPVHAVSLVDHQRGIVLTQGHVEKTDVATTSELTGAQEQEEHEAKKQKSELAVACRLIHHIDWKGKVLTGDALYCQRGLCSARSLAGGDYLFLVKGNQPHLFEDVRVLAGTTRTCKTSR